MIEAMIVKIQPPNSNVENAVRYNERKMNGLEGIREQQDKSSTGIEDGHVLVTRNVPPGRELLDLFQERRLLSIKNKGTGPKLKQQTFHMSVNPSEDDRKLSEKETVDLIDEIMAALGYQNQPYRIYKHTDIERTHYHVVSCRIDENGRKVKDSFERLVLREALKKLAPKYGFSVILSEEEKKKEGLAQNVGPTNENEANANAPAEPNAKTQEKPEKSYVPPFSRKNGPVADQIRAIAKDAMKWHFTTFEQFQSLLQRRYNVIIDIENGTNGSERLCFFGSNAEGNTVTPPLTEEELGIQLLGELKEQIAKEKKIIIQRREQRERIEKLTKAAFAIAKDYDDFLKLMERKGAIVIAAFTKDHEPFGVTYLDKATKCAWKGSQTNVDIKWLKKQCSSRGWQIMPDQRQSYLEKHNEIPSRKKTLTPIPETNSTGSLGDMKTVRKFSGGSRKSFLSGSTDRTGGLVPAYRTHGSTKKAGDGEQERRKDIDDDRPVQLVH